MKNLQLFSTLFILTLTLSAFDYLGTKKIKPVQDWVRLGEKVVDMKADHDVLMVTAKDGLFTALKFKVLKAPIHVKSVVIHYGNGNSQRFNINKNFPKGSQSKVLDLPGNKRIINRIVFNYKTINNGNGRAVVVAWGRH